MEQKLLETLKKYWHYDSFRPMQQEAMEAVLEGRDTLVLMPTGGGKSIIYQLPTLVSEGLCIVVTPLIALMKDQVDRLRRMGIPAVAIHSGLSSRQIDIALDNCVYGDVKFLYVAPERLSSEMFRLRVDRMNVSLLAVDEAHCISQWGYDFRPAYLKIKELRRLIPDTPVLALTASATPQVAKDIMAQLEFAEPNILQTSFLRPNLSYSVRETDDKEGQLLRIINNVPGCGIVYVRMRNTAERVANFLIEQGYSASFYHGGLPNAERALRQDEWVSGKTRIMVATNAFGMGIDKRDVRFVVHYTMSDSLESYYQEAGRAGRDGERSYAVILMASDDNNRIIDLFEKEFPDIDLIRSVYHELCSYLGVAIGDGKEASFVFNIYEFCRHIKLPLVTVHNIIKLLQLNGYLTLVEDCEHPARVMFMVTRDELYQVKMQSEKEEEILRTMLRLYTGIFSEFRPIDEMEIASQSKHSHTDVHDLLKRLWRANVIRYIPTNHDPLIFLDEERLPARDIYIAPATYSRRKSLMLERFNHLLHYANEESECRSRIIEQYFCDRMSEPCGICDNCLARKRKEKSTSANYEQQILSLLATEPMSIKELVAHIVGNEQSIIEAVRQLTEKGTISAEENKLTLETESGKRKAEN
ncbi:MAG: RecQ family ATP-dependent DNA helicase [Alistipes sp.]|nr:RecQ family ATP-dependent DNA helicase [Alistipes sp.]